MNENCNIFDLAFMSVQVCFTIKFHLNKNKRKRKGKKSEYGGSDIWVEIKIPESVFIPLEN